MKSTFRTALHISALLLPGTALAQTDAEPATVGGFTTQGSATFGYRFADVTGYQPKFKELFNLNSGPRLLDLSLFGDAAPGTNRFADSYSLTASGLGGEPYSSAQLTLRKKQVYDLRVNYRQSYYYWDRNDTAALPNGLSGLTSNHNWATVRKLGSLNLLIHASNNLKFTLEVYRNTRDGVSWVTRVPDYFGSSSAWGSFARANPYSMIAPLSENSNRVAFGADYTNRGWTFHYRLGYQRFESSVNGQNLITGQRSININDPATALELLNGASYADSRKLTTPISEFSYTRRQNPRLQWRGGYTFYRYSGPAAQNLAFDGTGRTNSAGTTDAPYSFFQASTASVTEPNHVLDQGFTYKLLEWWDFLADYRYTRFAVDSNGVFRSVNGTTVSTGTALEQWRVGTSTLDLNMAFTPASWLLIRPGIRLLKSDVKVLDDGVIDPARTKRIKTAWPTLSAYFEPSRMLTVRADVDQITNAVSYTRVTPHTDVGGRIVVRFKPFVHFNDKFYLEETAVVRNRRLLESDYRSTVRSNSVMANYDFSEHYSGFAGFSYDSNFVSDFVNFLRGTAPITNVVLQDQTVNRLWQLGVRARPMARLELSLSGNYVRTTGLGEITGEAPLYGPMKFPYATGTISYDIQHVGKLTVQSQRAYYEEQIVPGNNFGAKLLTIAYTRSF